MNKNIYLTSFLSLAFLLVGCEKDSQDIDVITGGNEPVALDIVIGGMEDYGDITSPETRSAENMVQSFVQPLDSTKDTGINIVTTVEMLPAEQTVETRANLDNDVVFTMEVYDNAGTLVGDNDYKISGTTATLVRGTSLILESGTYKFVCFTVNSNGVLPIKDGKIDLVHAHNFATFCTSKNITSSDHSLTIDFKRQMAKVQVDVNSNPTNTITYSSATFDKMTFRGYWYVNSESNDDSKIEGVRETLIGVTMGESVTVFPESRNVSLSLEGLTLNEINYGSKTILLPINFVKNGNYKITVQFEKSYSYTEIDGVKWAVSNLSYVNGRVVVSENPADKYNLVFLGGSLLGYKIASNLNAEPVVKPSEYSGAPVIKNAPNSNQIINNPAKGTGDPCTYYLGNNWRLPTQQEVYALGGTLDDNGRFSNSVWREKGTHGLQNVSGVFIGPGATSAEISGNTVTNNCIFIPASGYYFGPGEKYNDIALRGSFWTSQPSSYLLGSVGAGDVNGIKCGYYANNSTNYGHGIRCVHK